MHVKCNQYLLHLWSKKLNAAVSELFFFSKMFCLWSFVLYELYMKNDNKTQMWHTNKAVEKKHELKMHKIPKTCCCTA